MSRFTKKKRTGIEESNEIKLASFKSMIYPPTEGSHLNGNFKKIKTDILEVSINPLQIQSISQSIKVDYRAWVAN